MSKLKTLKDIGRDKKRECCSVEGYNNICERCIKQEAIKWVKDFRKKLEPVVADCFMSFFNITEEDLK